LIGEEANEIKQIDAGLIEMEAEQMVVYDEGEWEMIRREIAKLPTKELQRLTGYSRSMVKYLKSGKRRPSCRMKEFVRWAQSLWVDVAATASSHCKRSTRPSNDIGQAHFEEIHEGRIDSNLGHVLANMAKAIVATLSVSKTEVDLLSSQSEMQNREAFTNTDEEKNGQTQFTDLTST